MLKFLAVTAISGLLLNSYATAANVCSASQADLQSKISEIQKRYATKTDDFKRKIEQDVAAIKEDGPDPDNPVEAGVQLDFDITSHEEEFIFGLPEITVKDQELSLDLPQVTVKDQTWSYDLPTTRMRLQCTPGIPETVCGTRVEDVGFGIKTDVPYCELRAGADICLDLPELYMERHEIILGVPEFTMAKTSFVMGIPEITMKDQRIVLTIPDFTLKDVKVEQTKTEEASKALSNSAKAEAAQSAATLKSEVEQVSIQGIKDIFGCQISNLEVQKNDSLAKIDNTLLVFKSTLDKAREVGASDIAANTEASLVKLIEARNGAATKFDDAITKTKGDMEKTLKKAVRDGDFATMSAAQ